MFPTIAAFALLSASSISPNVAPSEFATNLLQPDAVTELTQSYSEQLQLGAGDTLRDTRRLSLQSGYVIQTQRFHQGVPVLNESATLRFDHSGVLQRVRTDFRPLDIASPVRVSALKARLSAIKAVWGIELPEAIFDPNDYDGSLAIDGPTQQWVYAAHIPGISPHQYRIVLVNATTGAIQNIINPNRSAANSANVFEPHPNPSSEIDGLNGTTEVSLANLQSETHLRGQWVNAHNCLTDEDNRRVFTCDTLVPILAGGFQLPDNLTCNDPLVSNLVGEFKHMVVAVCGPTHKATPDGTNGYTGFEPTEPVPPAVYPDASFEDGFAEVNLYYHTDKATEFFRSLGFEAPPTPLDGAVNLSLPSGDLVSCGQEAMQQAGSTDSETGISVISECMESLTAQSKPAFSGVPNAFFSPKGPITNLLGFDDGGIFFFQGPAADFAYDGDVIYHEFGHNVVHQLGNNKLTGGNILDDYGLDDSPGALNEAYADYFAGVITEDPVVGGYVAPKTGMGAGIRRLDHDLACPDFWAGQVHADSWGWAGALWEARDLYPQTETNDLTGQRIRIFDRAVLDGLKALTTNSLYKDAAEATIEAVMADAGLEDPDGQKIREVLEARNVLDCKRVRPLNTETPIGELFVVAGPSASSGPQDAIMGGQSYRPYAPPAIQFKVAVADLGNGEPVQCATFQAKTTEAVGSSEGLDIPDLIGGEDPAPTDHKLKLLYNTEGPVKFEYSGNVNVQSPQDDNLIEVTTTLSGSTFTAPLYFGEDADVVHYALINEGGTSPRLTDIKLVDLNQNCVDPNAPVAPETQDEAEVPVTQPATETSGCDCNSTSPTSLLLLGLGAILMRRRKQLI